MLVPERIRIAIVDDHPIVIEGLRSMLRGEAGLQTLSFSTGTEIIDFIRQDKADVVLLDVMLPDRNGIEVCGIIKQLAPDTVVLGLSNQAEQSIIRQMLAAGASGYVLKNAGAEELLACISDAQAGHTVFSREVTEIMRRPIAEKPVLPALTKREKQILQLIAGGQTTQQIAEQLFLSPFTVETHRRNLLQKMDVKNMPELIRLAAKQQLI